MPNLTPRQDAFCRAYAVHPNGAAAARDAGYSEANASHQAARLLKRADIQARIAALGGAAADRHAALSAERAAIARELVAQLAPIYEAALAEGDRDGVLEVVEMRARVWGLVSGGSTARPRGPRPPAPAEARRPDAKHDRDEEVMRELHDRSRKYELCLERIAELLDPDDEHDVLRRYGRGGYYNVDWARDWLESGDGDDDGEDDASPAEAPDGPAEAPESP